MTTNQISKLVTLYQYLRYENILHWDISYISEKWEKIIGTIPNEKFKCRTLFNHKIDSNSIRVKWKEKWKRYNLSHEENLILEYLCYLNGLAWLSQFDVDGINEINEIVDGYKFYIGDPELIKEDVYNHTHPIISIAIKNYMIENRRSINLIILT